MPRRPKFDYRDTPDGWCVNVPASVTATGRREQHFFKSRDLAKAHAAKLKTKFFEQGVKASEITPSLAQDATAAVDLLAKWNVTLQQAARFYVAHHDKRAKAPTLDEAWNDGLAHRKNHRDRTRSDFKAWQKALPDWFMGMNCHDITAKDIRKALDQVTNGPTRWKNGLRYVSAILGDVVKAELLEKNPAAAVHVARVAESENDEVVIYTPDELRSLFAACRDYPAGIDKNCAACAIPFAFMAFAGVRPDEVAKLKWEHVSTELHNIRIGPSLAKKAYRRNVRIQPTLAAWIATVPPERRTGKIVPARWTYKAAKVRSMAGIDGREKQDALRHSFGSYLLATENNLDLLKQDMGHAHMAVFFESYHKALTKREALPYWQILPPGAATATPLEIVA
jgi:integrase